MRITTTVGYGKAEEDGKWWVKVDTEPSDGSDPVMVGPFDAEEECKVAFEDTREVVKKAVAEKAAN